MQKEKHIDPKVSIIIPCFNRIHYLERCLASIEKQSYTNYEVIIIDDNSADDIKDLLCKRFLGKLKTMKYLKNSTNRFPSFTKNEGILLADGEYLLFLDSDSELFQIDSIRFSVSFLERRSEFAVVGGEAGFDLNGNHISVHSPRFKIYPSFTLDIRDHYFTRDAFKEVEVVDTSNMMIKKDIIHELGGFDPGYEYPHEDTDLCYRLRQNNYKIAITFKSSVIHRRTPCNRMNQIFFVSRARIRYQIKHFGASKVKFYNVFDKSIVDILFRRVPTVYKSLVPTTEIVSSPFESRFRLVSSSKAPMIKKMAYLVYYLHKAIVVNMFHLRGIRLARHKNFLADDEDLLDAVSKGGVICSSD